MPQAASGVLRGVNPAMMPSLDHRIIPDIPIPPDVGCNMTFQEGFLSEGLLDPGGLQPLPLQIPHELFKTEKQLQASATVRQTMLINNITN
jgi:hypothetical protein